MWGDTANGGERLRKVASSGCIRCRMPWPHTGQRCQWWFSTGRLISGQDQNSFQSDFLCKQQLMPERF